LLVLLCAAAALHAQDSPSTEQLFAQERWAEVASRLAAVNDRSAEQEYEYGLALAHLQRWQQARTALAHGASLHPHDKRFPVELAGIAFKRKDNGKAIGYLRRALRLDAKDDYAKQFLATLYFLEGNTEAAVKYWNRLVPPKPEIAEVRSDPPLQVRPALLDHAFDFSPAASLTLPQALSTEARLNLLGVFSNYRLSLTARSDGRFDSVLRAQELNGFGDGTINVLLRTFRGLPFQEVTPAYYNFHGSAINLITLARWDANKRRYWAELSAPLGRSPQWRYRLSFDSRNENWEIRNGFTGPAPLLASLNLIREAGALEITRLIGWRWQWALGAELSNREFRNAAPGSSLTPPLLEAGFQIKQTAGLRYEILRSPEHRLRVSTALLSSAGRLWSQPGEAFEKFQASLRAHWLPQLKGDDFETSWGAHAGKTFGQLPFDELFMLGLERDNDPDLWMRAHTGTRDGRKGSAPLGRDYFLASWETDKNLCSNGFFNLKLGPFIDTGSITSRGTTLGSRKWLVDTGAEAKLRVLGVGVALVFGKDLRTGSNAFYATLAR
jgi:tetratricopeptide (TPR) repeat protein